MTGAPLVMAAVLLALLVVTRDRPGPLRRAQVVATVVALAAIVVLLVVPE